MAKWKNRENSGSESAIVAALMKMSTRTILKGIWHYAGRWVALVIWCLGVAGTTMEASASIRRSNYVIFGGMAAVYLL